MRTPRLTYSRLTVGLALVALAGCSGEKIKTTPLPEGTDPSQEISKIDQSIEKNRAEQLDFLAPDSFAKSEAALKKAKELRSEGRPSKDVLEKLAESQAFLERAEKRGEVSTTILNEVKMARADAVKANAPGFFRDEFIRADQEYYDAARKIEKGETRISDEDRNRLIQRYRGLETQGIRASYLNEPSELLSKAKKEGAAKWAPRTLTQAENSVGLLDSAIRRNVRDSDALRSMSEQAKDRAQNLLEVTRQAKVVQSRHPEETVLQIEKQQKDISKLGKEAESSTESLARSQQKIGELATEKAFNDRVSRVQSSFEPDEAEVLRTDNKVIIRLKGLKFSVAGTDIPSEDFSLLSKAEQAIFELGPENKVTIEGHTDATGSKKKNEQISLQRAKSVKDFLTSSNQLPTSEIEVAGKGFSRPIASDKTPEGRALNRRVDIIIEAPAG